jgi:threonine dehydrogenase-like Zn-dependent dehydrogenase
VKFKEKTLEQMVAEARAEKERLSAEYEEASAVLLALTIDPSKGPKHERHDETLVLDAARRLTSGAPGAWATRRSIAEESGVDGEALTSAIRALRTAGKVELLGTRGSSRVRPVPPETLTLRAGDGAVPPSR